MYGAANFGSLVGGFNDESGKIRQQEHDDAQKQADRDSKVFDALANSDDPEIRAAAVTGLLTGNHPARGIDKWFGKVQQHPAYEQIKGLVANGHQPFLGTEGSEAAKTRGSIEGRVSGAANAYNDNAGEWPSEEFIGRVVSGAAGAPQKTEQLQYGTAFGPGGAQIPAAFHPLSGQYIRQDQGHENEPLPTGFRFSHSGTVPTTPTNRWDPGTIADTGQFPGEHSPSGWRIQRDISGNITQHEAAQEGPPPVPAIVSTPTGNVGVGRGGKEVALPPAARGGKAATPTESLSALKQVQASVLKDAGEPPKPIAQGLQVDPAAAQAYVAARDKAAQRYGYKDYAALQAALGEGGGAVGASTPPPPEVPAVGAGARGKPAAKGRAGGAGGGAGARGATIDVDAVLKELGR